MRPAPIARAPRYEMLAALGLTGLLGVMHIVLLLNRGPLWRDEISSLSLATAPTWPQFWAGLGLDPMPAFFPLLLRAWKTIAGDSDFHLRILGCLIGLAGLGAFWMSARLTKHRTPLLSLVSLGICPTLIIWGDSLRGYGLGVFWIVLAFALFWQLIERPTRWTFAAATLAGICSVHSVYTNALLIFSCVLAAICVTARRREWARAGLVLGSGMLAAFSLVPYAKLVHATTEWADLNRIDFSLLNSSKVLAAALSGPREFLFWGWLALIGLALATTLIARPANSRRRDSTLYALLASVGGFIFTMTFFRVVGWGTNVWYYLPILAVAAVAMDLILDLENLRGHAPIARMTVALLGVIFVLPFSLRALDRRASNIDLAAAVISKQASEDDVVIVWPAPDGITFQRYLRRPLDWIAIPQVEHFPAQPGDDLLAPFREAGALQPVIEKVEAALKSNRRVWLASTWPLQLPRGPVPPVLPLSAANPRKMGYFLRGWGYLLAQEFQMHAAHISKVNLPNDQSISAYEEANVLVFEGWKDVALR